MQKLQAVGGLRKELTPEICVYMYIMHYEPTYNPAKAILMAAKVKRQVKQYNHIPF